MNPTELAALPRQQRRVIELAAIRKSLSKRDRRRLSHMRPKMKWETRNMILISLGMRMDNNAAS